MFQKVKNSLSGGLIRQRLRIVLIFILCLLSAFSISVLQSAVKTYHIADGKRHYVVHSVSEDVSQALKEAELCSENYRIVSSGTAENVTSVEIEYVFPVYITVANQTVEYFTAGGTVGEILQETGHTVDRFDLIQPAADTEISETTYIDYTNIDYKTVEKQEKIAHGTKTVKSASLAKGKEKVVKGSDGLQQVSYSVKYVNGVEKSRQKQDVKVLKKAVDTVRTVGTKVAVTTAKKKTTSSKLTPKQRVLASVGNVAIAFKNGVKAISKLLPTQTVELDQNNRPVNYTKKITVGATAYTHTGHNCATGVKPKPGYIAVNPKLIPYGTKMFIVSKDGKFVYGYAVAADTGGFAKKRPNNVDLFFDTLAECYKFGRRDVVIYFLP